MLGGIVSSVTELRPDLTADEISESLSDVVSVASLWSPGSLADAEAMTTYLDAVTTPLVRWQRPTTSLVDPLETALVGAASRLLESLPGTWVTPALRCTVDNLDGVRAITGLNLGWLLVVPHIERRSEQFWWSWPIRIGVLAGSTGSDDVVARVERSEHQQLFDVRVVTGEELAELDLLVVLDPSDLQSTLPTAAAVVVLRPAEVDPTAAIDAVLSRCDPGAVVSAERPEIDGATWFNRLIVELSHDSPLDVAASIAFDSPVVVADSEFLAMTSVRTWALSIARQLDTAGPAGAGPADELRHIVMSRRFNSEEEGNTDVVGVIDAISPTIGHLAHLRAQRRFASAAPDDESPGIVAPAAPSAPAGPPVAPPAPASPAAPSTPAIVPPPAVEQEPALDRRQLQADQFAAGQPLERAFVGGVVNTVQISIGHHASARTGVNFPTPDVSVTVELIKLTVRFSAGPVDESRNLWLPVDPGSDSGPATFEVTPDIGAARLSAFVGVYFGPTFLQGGILSGDIVADGGAERSHHPSISFVVDERVKQFFGPASNTTASVVVTDVKALAASRAGAGDGPQFFAADVGALHDVLGRLAVRIKQASAAVIGGDIGEFDKALRDLARHGGTAYQTILDQLGVDLCTAEQIQVVSAGAATVLPLELVYDGPPATANSELCDTWQQALRSGSCRECAGHGPHADQDLPDPRICPMRFWAVSKVIERHRTSTATDGRYQIRSFPSHDRSRLAGLDRAIVGSSNRVTTTDQDALSRFAADLLGSADLVINWQQWRTAVSSGTPPNVLIALPHHDQDGSANPPLDALELGGVLLPLNEIARDVVGGTGDAPGPVVVLLGCSTANNATPLESFAARFVSNGAAVVVATLADVYPEEAVPAAKVIVGELERPSLGGTIGHVLLAARRNLLAERHLIGLISIALGDADWQLPEGP